MFGTSVIDKKYLEGLSDYQLEVVNHQDGVVRVNATAGSGKTSSITRRIAHMISNDIDPNSILLTTFTKQAAQEMKKRISKFIGKHQLDCLTIGTLHSISFKILRDVIRNTDHPYKEIIETQGSDMFLMNEGKRIFAEKIVQQLVKDLRNRYDHMSSAEYVELEEGELGRYIGRVAHLKNKAIGPMQYSNMINRKNAFEIVSLKFYEAYEERKLIDKKLDMEDLLLFTYDIFKEYPDLLAKYQNKFKYVITDESQDQNSIQNKIVKMLAAPDNNICLVGDVSQAIFGFQGGKPEEFIGFIDDYNSAKQLNLPINYRSKSHVVDVANKLIKNNTLRINQDAIAHKQSDDQCVTHHNFINETDQAKFVFKKITEMKDQGKDYKDVAVLFRTNAQSRSLEEVFMKNEIPYTLHSSYRFYDRKEIAEILGYLKLVRNREDNEAFQKIYNKPNRYLGKRVITQLNSYNQSNWNAVDSAIELKPFEMKNIQDFKRSVDKLQMEIEKNGVAKGIIYILKKIGYEKAIKNQENYDERMENINVLVSMSKKFSEVGKFLSYIDLLQSKKKQSKDSVQLMSIHRSKGLEYENVFIIGMNEGLMPHSKALDLAELGDNKQIEEERRLAYVAITRAIDRLYLCSSSIYSDKMMEQSRFVKEMGY
ncbi:ATP-dependent helicase [Bacillus sp. Marseille-P3800]|uniref:ATP-dependent helicase n=1 Tax=Bacillus sp. Marseille-P3800 TaxID=2014782 RepID=UPI000C078983|nr:ATP-dependent helicase [Bacillus sp. Marseille-P3800]